MKKNLSLLINSKLYEAQRLAKHYNGFWTNQFKNQYNPESHYLTTGPEIWKQMEGKIDYIFVATGSGGSISGIAKYCKEQDPNVKVIGKKIKKN